MTDATSPKSARRHHWRRDVVELAAMFTAVTVADGIANTVAHGPSGPFLLCASAAALVATAGFHTWWSHTWSLRRHESGAPPGEKGNRRSNKRVDKGDTGATAPMAPAAQEEGERETALWRMRTTVRDEPGSLAALCTALAGHRVDILSLQTHPLSDGTVDEFLLRTPAALPPADLSRAVTEAGGADTWLERADAHDLVDAPTRMLQLATRTALDSAELPLALRQLLGRCTIRSMPLRSPAGAPLAERVPEEGVLEEHTMTFRDPSGGSLTIERPRLPFTPTEFARVRALVGLDARLGQRVPPRRDVLTLPEGNAITIRRADTSDLVAAREMHERCSERTLSLRYHGPVADAERYLGHLLSPRFGRTLAVETTSGRLVALGHLLWDGDETEVALVVEDAWQRRGIGAELLRRLVGMAAEAGCESVYAITQASNTGMVAAMRGLGLPLDYQIEDGTLVITARPTVLVTRRETHESVRVPAAPTAREGRSARSQRQR
ncbi:GNAT family N-acetyltransferase [Streptomyces sp. MST-110588]|uniref:GNAT family N-acetyltransferase n=1 Tax=Streptomyces sp. MST-110588 TaxID=2833628 RepID=UPI001F5CB779|nr:GNAT family N-acetyltransferase [Streptomyces sp. MST-110588]UNO38632.1 GNAT family N-acetyltransferase [Streptomyces sp. MST-110588]